METRYNVFARRFASLLLLAASTGAAALGAFRSSAVFANTGQPADTSIRNAPQEEAKKMGRPVVHFEIGCRDSARTRSFYTDLFDWDVDPAGTIDTHGGAGIPGHITALGHEPHNYVTVYVQVEDLKSSLSKAEKLGGKTLVPPIDIPTGRFAWLADPDGNIVGLLQPKAQPAK